MAMPIDPRLALKAWDAVGRYPSASAHQPTVAGGKALVLCLLPDGAVVFS